MHGDLLPEAREGWGCLRSAWGSPAGGAGGVGDAGKSVWVSLCEGAGGVGVPEKCMGIPCRRRGRGGGGRQKCLGIPLRRRGRGGGGGQKRMGISLRRRGWGGVPASSLGTHLQGTRTGSVGYSEFWERRRQGRGNEFPLPVGPTPNGDIPTVQCMGRSWRRAGYGCSPDIASTAHAPRKGAGEERRRRGRGGGGRRGIRVSPAAGTGGMGRRRYVGSRER